MTKFTKSDSELGDIHAPVEDTDVPLALKLLVVLMLLIVIAAGIMVTLTVTQLLPR